jgi:PIF1 helicase.
MVNNFAFEFKRVKFPASLAFAMSIKKCQGQSLAVSEINFEFPCYSHNYV